MTSWRSAGTAAAERVEVCNRWRVDEDWWRAPIERDYFKVVGERWLALVYLDRVDGTWHSSGCTTDRA